MNNNGGDSQLSEMFGNNNKTSQPKMHTMVAADAPFTLNSNVSSKLESQKLIPEEREDAEHMETPIAEMIEEEIMG